MDQDAAVESGVDGNRRAFLRRAAVAGTAVWAVPTIVTIDPAAAAEATSPPPEPEEPSEEIDADVEPNRPAGGELNGPAVLGSSQPGSGPQVLGSQTAAPQERSGSLADTGVEVEHLVAGGLAATAGGAALKLWKADIER